MISVEAVWSLLFLLIVISLLPAAERECSADVIYQEQAAQDAASVLQKAGVLEMFAYGKDEEVKGWLGRISALSGNCVALEGEGREIGICEAAGEGRLGAGKQAVGNVAVVERIAAAPAGFERVKIKVWKK